MICLFLGCLVLQLIEYLLFLYSHSHLNFHLQKVVSKKVVLYENWDKISEEFRKNEDRLSDVDLPNNILSALTY
jgi:hypothetical protein